MEVQKSKFPQVKSAKHCPQGCVGIHPVSLAQEGKECVSLRMMEDKAVDFTICWCVPWDPLGNILYLQGCSGTIPVSQRQYWEGCASPNCLEEDAKYLISRKKNCY